MSNLNVFPTSPVPAPLGRSPHWNESIFNYDSGGRQGITAYQKPLMGYTINISNMPRTKQRSLFHFYNQQRGMVTPFLFQDPYDDPVAGTIVVRTGTHPSSFRIFDANSFYVIPRSGGTLITSALSGALTPGSHYVIDHSTGIVVASLLPASADFWTASCDFFRKVAFNQQYDEVSNIFDNFNGNLTLQELT